MKIKIELGDEGKEIEWQAECESFERAYDELAAMQRKYEREPDDNHEKDSE